VFLPENLPIIQRRFGEVMGSIRVEDELKFLTRLTLHFYFLVVI